MTARSKKQEKMFALIEEWKQSGQSQIEFCREQGLAYASFHYWYKRYRQRQSEDHSEPFQAITFPTGRSSGAALEISLPDGKVLSFFHPIDLNLVKTLLK